MRNLHIVQGGIKNGDKAWLERAARNRWGAPNWIVPKSVSVGDDVVIFVGGYGFFATARVNSQPTPRSDWRNRYGSGLDAIKLIEPAISLGAIRRHIPDLKWAIYPRSVTTPTPEIAAQIRVMVSKRRNTGIPDLDDEALAEANIDELRRIALLHARQFVSPKKSKTIFRARSLAIHKYVLCRADGRCVNDRGRLTIVECKLWKNPQARREVVAQTLDYVSALSGWSYLDLEKQVAAGLGKQVAIFEVVRRHTGSGLSERKFVEAVSQSLREGRFLVLIVGDGFREGMQSLTELINRNSTKAFSFGLVEIALYRIGKGRLAIQPRVLAKSEVIVRHVTIVSVRHGNGPFIIEDTDGKPKSVAQPAKSGNREHLKAWWEPVLRMKFENPDQEPPFWAATNNVVLRTPFPGIHIKALAIVNSPQIGVFVSGQKSKVAAIQKFLKRERRSLLSDLPDGTEIRIGDDWPVMLSEFDLQSDDERRAWIKKTLNTFANVLRPRLRKWYDETQQ